MRRAKRLIKLALREEGATMVEYGIVLFFIAAVLVTLAAQIGQITLTFFNVGNSL
jgi:Flp pilus assembly pilin Flp